MVPFAIDDGVIAVQPTKLVLNLKAIGENTPPDCGEPGIARGVSEIGEECRVVTFRRRRHQQANQALLLHGAL